MKATIEVMVTKRFVIDVQSQEEAERERAKLHQLIAKQEPQAKVESGIPFVDIR